MQSSKTQVNRVKLYLSALQYLGTDASPFDEAPDEYGCADSVSKVILSAFPNSIIGSVSTKLLYEELSKSKQFVKVLEFQAGDVIISPTGMGKTGKIANGHTGIVGENEEILSNSSATGTWENNYTMKSWVDRFRTAGGYPIFFFRKV